MKISTSYPVENIFRKFQLQGAGYTYRPFGSGHINDTFLLNGQPGQQYLLQRINHEVFTDVEGLMSNIERVTQHLQQALAAENDTTFTAVRLIPTESGSLYHRDDTSGLYWRVQTFVPNSTSYDLVSSEEQAFQAGYAFGYFQKLLRDMPADSLKKTIPNFHNMEYRFANFSRVLDEDPVKKKESVMAEIDFVLKREQPMLDWYRLVRDQVVPLRITHNDTKFNNVLLDQRTEQAISVIDLDTVMPGAVGYDFGDAIRTTVNTATEDEVELPKIGVNLSYYRAFARGFLQEVGPFLTEEEINSLAFSAHYMTFIMGLRFLTDYLEGNVYYKVDHPQHNLHRAKSQFALLTNLEECTFHTQEMLQDIYRNRPARS